MTRARRLLPLALVAACGADRTPAQTSPPAANAVEVAPAPAPAERRTDPDESVALDPRFEGVLLAAAADYRRWGRVDERPSLAPTLCRAPVWPHDYGAPAHARLSKSERAPHGRKLYYLYAHDRHGYLQLGRTGAPPPIGTTIVKQSWTAVPGKPKPAEPADGAGLGLAGAPPPVTWVDTDDGPLHAGEQADLFIISKLAPETPGTDGGWVYGTVTPDGKTVTSAGLVDRCIGCHEDAPHERLFGLQKTKVLAPLPPRPDYGVILEPPADAGVN
jgi:hypothetical protein